jgi:hypothetical protein
MIHVLGVHHFDSQLESFLRTASYKDRLDVLNRTQVEHPGFFYQSPETTRLVILGILSLFASGRVADVPDDYPEAIGWYSVYAGYSQRDTSKMEDIAERDSND